MRKLCVLLMILMVLLASSAAADVMLTLPSSLIKIEDEAFAGDTSSGKHERHRCQKLSCAYLVQNQQRTLYDAIDIVGRCGVTGLAAQNDQEFLAVFQVLDPAFTSEKLALMIAAGELWNYAETSDPFGAGALFAVSDEPPAAGSGYEAFVI